MKICKYAICAIAFALSASNAFCLATKGGSGDGNFIKNSDLFGIQFPDGLTYWGKTSYITGASMQEYVVGTFMVTEVVIDFSGAKSLLRIYNMRRHDIKNTASQLKGTLPANLAPHAGNTSEIEKRAVEAEEKLKEKFGAKVTEGQSVVAKVYPTTTHAATVEYSIENLEELKLFYLKFSMDLANSSRVFDYNADLTEAAETAKKVDSSFALNKKLYIFDKKENEK